MGITASSMSLRRYRYQPLEECWFRILHLEPHRDRDAPIQCKLVTHPLLLDAQDATAPATPYEALSYTWGPSLENKRIELGGVQTPVTDNLHAALVHLRDPSTVRTMWVDALCINQNDLDERQRQVQAMALIYNNASRVIVWLGEADEWTEKAFGEIHRSANGKPASIIFGVVSLLRREWFRRVWVLQEIAAAQSILVKCGGSEMEGYTFATGLSIMNSNFAGWLDYEDKDYGPVCSTADLMRRTIFRPIDPVSKPSEFSLSVRPLGELLDLYRKREATQRHDKVYALLGMSSDASTSKTLLPDYKTPWADLLAKVAQTVLGDHVRLITTLSRGEVAVIRAKGRVAGRVTSVEDCAEGNDERAIRIKFRGSTSHTMCDRGRPIKRGDLICMLEGAAKPIIVRTGRYCLLLVASSVNVQVPEAALSASTPRDLLLWWDWGNTWTTHISFWFIYGVEKGRVPGYKQDDIARMMRCVEADECTFIYDSTKTDIHDRD